MANKHVKKMLSIIGHKMQMKTPEVALHTH